MRTAIPAALTFLGATTFGSLAFSGGYAWYWRSDAYRNRCASVLTAALRMPSRLGPITPRSTRTREFDDVVVSLPDGSDEVLSCRRSIVRMTPLPRDPEAYEIEIWGGKCEISPRTWLREVVEPGLRYGFDPDGPQRVAFDDMDVTFERADFKAGLRAASGSIDFLDELHATITGSCRELNGYVSAEPVTLRAAFSPQERGVRIDRLEIHVPSLPLEVLRLGQLMRVAPKSGRFDGTLVYEERDDGRHLELHGKCYDLQLAEITGGMATPWRGRCPELDVQSLTIFERAVTGIHFSGSINGLVLGDILSPWGFQAAGGATTLLVRDAKTSERGIERLAASGSCEGISIVGLSQKIGRGEASGTARIVIDDLVIDANRLVALDARVLINDPGETPNWIEGKLVTSVVEQMMGIKLPVTLPARVPYSRFGVRLEVRDEKLRVYGTYGTGEKTMMTLRVMGFDVPINETQQVFDLTPQLNEARVAGLGLLQRPPWNTPPHLFWRSLLIPQTQPASLPARPAGGPQE